jgi:hypothetical protein
MAIGVLLHYGKGEKEKRKEKVSKKLTTQPYSRAGRVEVVRLRKTPVVFCADTTGGRTQNVFDLRRGRAW